MQEHIQQLKKMYIETNDPYRCSALKVAMEAVRKQIPREIKRKMCDGCKKEDCEGCEDYYNRCPSCGEGLDRDSGELFKYCPKCGQALSL